MLATGQSETVVGDVTSAVCLIWFGERSPLWRFFPPLVLSVPPLGLPLFLCSFWFACVQRIVCAWFFATGKHTTCQDRSSSARPSLRDASGKPRAFRLGSARAMLRIASRLTLYSHFLRYSYSPRSRSPPLRPLLPASPTTSFSCSFCSIFVLPPPPPFFPRVGRIGLIGMLVCLALLLTAASGRTCRSGLV